MNFITVTADSAAEAIAQIQQRLGPAAVVLRVRRVHEPGLARLWQKPRIEVDAHVPPQKTHGATSVEDVLEKIRQLNRHLPPLQPVVQSHIATQFTGRRADSQTRGQPPGLTRLPTQSAVPNKPNKPNVPASPAISGTQERLHELGIIPRLAAQFSARVGEPPSSISDRAQRIRWVDDQLRRSWRQYPAEQNNTTAVHAFVGPPGSGKTTVLCKWLAQSVLLGGRSPMVWRLDAQSANTSEALSIYGEILGVPVERTWTGTPPPGPDECFVDFPGGDWNDRGAREELIVRLGTLGPAQIHLVLNAAYEVPLLFDQIQRAAPLGITDLIFTHLDEEQHWSKLWNFVLGTNYAVRFLSAGQNVPGTLRAGSPELLDDDAAASHEDLPGACGGSIQG